MSSSFADAVRGGGESLAGNPSEEDDAWSGKANPLEAVLRCPKTIAQDPVLRALISRCGPTALSCVRSISATNYVITCSSEAFLLMLINEPIIDIDNARCTISRAGEPLRSVTLRNIPFDATDDDLRALLKPYATLIEWSHEVYQDFPGIANGNRRLHIKMPTPLPNFLTFRKKRVVVSYNGVQLLCFRCGSPDHSKKDCKKTIPAQTPKEVKTVEPTVPVPTPTTPMPPPATPNSKVNKRKKITNSPAPSQSPSPRSHKRQHGPSPSASAAGKSAFVAQSSSPTTRHTRSGPICYPRQAATIVVDNDEQEIDIQEFVFQYFLETEADGSHNYRPNVKAGWIQHWCESCWASTNRFDPAACASSPPCRGWDVSDLGLPTSNGLHLFVLSTAERSTYCRFDVRSKGWTISEIDENVPYHRGPLLPEYSSAPSWPC